MSVNLRLLETGDVRLLETGDSLLLEIQPTDINGFLLLETGDNRLLENGLPRVLEDFVYPSDFFLGFGVSGKLGKPMGPDPFNVHGIYQMRMTKRGKVPIKMKFYVPTNPRTPAQQANRQKFADAQAAWMALTLPEKLVYTTRAKRRFMFGWGLFIREYYQEN